MNGLNKVNTMFIKAQNILLESGRTGTKYWIELEKENQRIMAKLLDNAVEKDRDFN